MTHELPGFVSLPSSVIGVVPVRSWAESLCLCQCGGGSLWSSESRIFLVPFLSLKLGERHAGRRTKLLIPFTFQFLSLFFPSPSVEFLRHTAALGSMFEPRSLCSHPRPLCLFMGSCKSGGGLLLLYPKEATNVSLMWESPKGTMGGCGTYCICLWRNSLI